MERFTIDPPYEMVRINRGTDDGPGAVAVNRADDWLELLRQPIEYQPSGTVAYIGAPHGGR